MTDGTITQQAPTSHPAAIDVGGQPYLRDAKEGQINRAELFMLLRVEIADERWVSAMTAIRESMRIIGSRLYVRFYDRPASDAPWHAVTIDLAAA